MAEIYSNAFCNLAAVGAADCPGDTSAGLFFDRDVGCLQVPILERPKHQGHKKDFESGMPLSANDVEILVLPDDGKHMLIDNDLWSREINRSCLASRAWVLQERLLPKRVIHFAKHQLFFECPMSQACEAYPYGFNITEYRNDTDIKYDFGRWQDLARNTNRRRSIPTPLDPWAQERVTARDPYFTTPLDTWARIVNAYSQCALTFERDKLIALSGIARELKALFRTSSLAGNPRYFAGLWAESFYEQLLWRRSFRHTKRPSIYVAPTWSWASITGPVRAISSENISKELEHHRLGNILDASVTTVDSDEMSLVLEGHIRISGKLIPIEQSKRWQAHDIWLAASIPTRDGIKIMNIWPDVPEEVETSKCYAIPMLEDPTHN